MRLEIHCQNRVGIAQEILAVCVEHHIDLQAIELDHVGIIFISLPDINEQDYQQLNSELLAINGINNVLVTTYLPSELTSNELISLVNTFPDPFFSLDISGTVRLFNTAAKHISPSLSVGSNIETWLTGIDISQWLAKAASGIKHKKVTFENKAFVAEIIASHLIHNEQDDVAGAVIILKSEQRLGEQINIFNQPQLDPFHLFQAHSGSMRKVISEAKRMALLEVPMLISGETGTGKELLAHTCYQSSHRANKPFMVLSCAALPDKDAESELFGCGALGDMPAKRGLFELADGGTLFLDEVAEMSPTLQVKLLRVLQSGSFRRVDDEAEIHVDVRIISSTKQNLLNKIELGEFRDDLYYRLNVTSVNIAPLSERRSDIIPLAKHFLAEISEKSAHSELYFSDDCLEFLEHYPWPGNCRQLQNAVIRASSLVEKNVINTSDLELPFYSAKSGYLSQDFEGTLETAVKAFEANLLKKLFPAYPSSRQLGKKLGLSHTAVANKLREYGINKK